MVVATLATLEYEVTILGPTSGASMATLMDPTHVPPPFDSLAEIGVQGSTDGTGTGGGMSTRTLVLALVETATATATVTADASANGGPIVGTLITAPGSGYVRNPVPVVTETAPGVTPTRTALVDAALSVDSVIVGVPGSGYTAPIVSFVGGALAPGGTPAQATATVGIGGAITGIVVTNRGGPYLRVPQVVITGSNTGAANAVASMRVGFLTIVDPGSGYVSPAIAIVPFFKKVWPDGASDQRQPFYNLLTNALQQSTSAKVKAFVPVLS